MIRGVTVIVKAPASNGVDRFGNPVTAFESSTVENVLVSPGATADLEASRPEGVTVSYTLHFPKTFTGDLEGCVVTLPEPWAGDFAVIGSPGRYIDANTPTPWDMPVEVAAAHG